MKLPLTLLTIIFAYTLSAQTTVHKIWDERYGGDSSDYMYAMCQTKDGGYVLGGTSYSGVGGNKTQSSRGDADYWIVKIDANGNYLWDKRYGGPGADYFTAISSTNDGGCIMGGFSGSGIGGDKTQAGWGGFDFWVVKVDSIGNKQWDKRYGGSYDESVGAIRQTKDGGYIIGGYSSSHIGGDKSEDTRGGGDYWIVKIDSAGIKQWDKRFGTTADEGAMDVIQTPDGGYLVGGHTQGDSTGDKTQANYCSGQQNYWVVKTDSLGNKLWDKRFGGCISGEIFGNSLNTTDGNYLLGGTSFDGIDGDKSVANCGYWLVKIDTGGNKIGDWVYGTGVHCGEIFSTMTRTADNGYLLTGKSGANNGGDKSENNLGDWQIWTIKIDSSMHKVWDKTALTMGVYDYSAGAIQVTNSCAVIGVQTGAGIGGDKTQAAWDSSYDYWVVEYCDTLISGITELAGDIHYSIYPNPTTREVSIMLQRDGLREADFSLTNPSGQIIYQSTDTNLASTYTKILDLGTLPSGIYVLTITADGQRIVRKIVKE